MASCSTDITAISRDLARAAARLRFGAPVTHVYNPLEYALQPHLQYLERYARPSCEVLLMGMNPGPFGMAQTGVPFGDVALVRDWMGIEAFVEKPAREHPKRPVLGFDCRRSEVSGTRLWGWARDRFGAPEHFFARFFVYNYCPLSFMVESGRNYTPDKLAAGEREDLFRECDKAFVRLVGVLKPRWLMGVGVFAETRILAALPGFEGTVGRIPHPSPANPAANRGWGAAAEEALRGCGVRLD